MSEDDMFLELRVYSKLSTMQSRDDQPSIARQRIDASLLGVEAFKMTLVVYDFEDLAEITADVTTMRRLGAAQLRCDPERPFVIEVQQPVPR